MNLAQGWATAIAAAIVVLVGFAVARRHGISPVVLISALLPLGAATAIFNMFFEVMKIPALGGDALSKAAVALASNASKAFITTLAIAVGVGASLTIVCLFKREETVGV